MCVCDFLCVYDEKKIIFRILLLVLWIYTPSFLTWNEEGCTTPCYFFFHFWCHTRFSFSFLLSLLLFDPQGPCIFGFFSVVFFFLKCDCSLFFLDEDSLPVRSVEPPPCMFIFFLSLGDAKNWQQKERKKKWVHRTCGHSHVTSRIFSPSLNGTHTHTWKGKKKSLHTEKEGIF